MLQFFLINIPRQLFSIFTYIFIFSHNSQITKGLQLQFTSVPEHRKLTFHIFIHVASAFVWHGVSVCASITEGKGKTDEF